jgi:imidazolonepropionase-like amidohydrolase
MISRKLCAALVLVPIAALSAESPNGPGGFAIQGARIFTGSGESIEGGTILVENGLVTAVGASVSVPEGAWVVDARGKSVYPGLIDALSSIGLPRKPSKEEPPGERSAAPRAQGPEDRPATSPFRAAADELSLEDERIALWRSSGFTSAVSVPEEGIVTGQAAFLNLAGERERELVVRTPVALRVNLTTSGSGRSFPESLMGVVAYVKQVFYDAAHYRESWAAYERSPRGKPRPEYDRTLAPLSTAQTESWPVLLPGSRKHEMVRALALAGEIGVKPVVYGVHEGYAAAEVLADANVPVLVSLKWPERGKDKDPEEEEPLRVLELRERAPSTPAVLEKAGVRFAFYTDGIAKPEDALAAVRKAVGAGLSRSRAVRALTLDAAAIYGLDDRLLPHEVGNAVAYGLPWEEGIKAITLYPAQLFGVADSYGSIEEGKVANLIVTDGDPLEIRTRVRYLFIDGKLTPLDNKHQRLYETYRARPQ